MRDIVNSDRNVVNPAENWIKPDWPVPTHVCSLVTTRFGGTSHMPYSSMNLAQHVSDSESAVAENRAILACALKLPESGFCWLQQVHSNKVVRATLKSLEVDADASFTDQNNQVCVVMTADCLPVLLCNESGSMVAAVHAGWRGLANGILFNALEKFSKTEAVLAWLGPAIGVQHFEVGDEVRQTFCRQSAENVQAFYSSQRAGKWYADIYQLARTQLEALGVSDIYGGDFCTYADAERFYSYRRDGMHSGRMASMIWLQSDS